MNITRHNYEEYFILYMDNELGSDDRRQVELFVEENPDLKGELNCLLQSRLTPDASVVFDAKKQLMKSSPYELINESNYQEWLLLYIDNELTAAQKMAAQELLTNHPAIRTELEILEKTKLQPEQTIIFNNKESLYHREEKVRVVSLQWRRIAVAAILLITLGTTVFIALNKKDNTEGPLVKNNPETKSAPAIIADQQKEKTINTTNQTTPENNNRGKEDAAIKNEAIDKGKRIITPGEKKNQRFSLPVKENAPVIADTKPEEKKSNNLPQPAYNPNVNPAVGKENPIAKNELPAKDLLTDFKEDKATPDVTPDNVQSLNNVIAAVEMEQPGKKNKLRGFFRKVTRNFEKRTNIKTTDDDDRLLLAGFAVKL